LLISRVLLCAAWYLRLQSEDLDMVPPELCMYFLPTSRKKMYFLPTFAKGAKVGRKYN